MQNGKIWFIGVTTGQSAVQRIFPRWMDALGRDVQCIGVDLPLDCPPARYRAIVERLRGDPSVLGAVITAHKVGIFDAARDLFARFDGLALQTKEVSAIAKYAGGLSGHAPDPVSVGKVLNAMLADADPPVRQVLCLGAGGTARSIAHHLLTSPPPPPSMQLEGFTAVDVRRERLLAFREVAVPIAGSARIHLHEHTDARDNDRLLAELPPGALIINASGLGKDRPGSPLTDDASWPEQAIAWEINYRGARPFLSQAEAKGARVHDGWPLFLRGLFQALVSILGLDESSFARLAGAAQETAAGKEILRY